MQDPIYILYNALSTLNYGQRIIVISKRGTRLIHEEFYDKHDETISILSNSTRDGLFVEDSESITHILQSMFLITSITKVYANRREKVFYFNAPTIHLSQQKPRRN